MNILTAINTLILLFSPINTAEVDIQPAGFRIQVYPFGGYYYSSPPCPEGYYNYGGRCYFGRPGYYYYGPGYYYNYPYRYGYRYNRGGQYRGRGGNRGGHGGRQSGGHRGGHGGRR